MMRTGIAKQIGMRKSSIPIMGLSPSGGLAAFSFIKDFINQPPLIDSMGRVGTLVRATIATVTDFESRVIEVLSGEARSWGLRRVRNWLTFTEDFSNAAWTLINGGTGSAPTKTPNFGTAPDGTATACRLVCTRGGGVSGSDYSLLRQALTSAPNYTKSVWLKSNTGASQSVCISVGGAGTAVTVTTTWQRFSVYESGTSVVYDIGSGISGLGQASIDILVWHPQAENVTGQSNQNPGEYQSVGVLAAPYQGWGVDGVYCYATQNGNTVASNVVTEATGAAINLPASGFLPEPAATDLLLARADARDMTTANWTLGATLTRNRNQVGADGVANKATLLTGGGVAATNRISMTFALAAAARTYSVLLKRGVGAGAVLISGDNFGTSTDISGLLNTTTFTLVQIVANVLNPIIGIQVSVAADTVIADWNQYNNGDISNLSNSRIPETITTRNGDNLTFPITGILGTNSALTLFAEWFNPNNGSVNIVASINDTTNNNSVNLYETATPTQPAFEVKVGGAFQCSLFAASIGTNAVAKAIGMAQANDFAAFANNTSLGTDVAGSMPVVTQINVGSLLGASQLGCPIRKVGIMPARAPSAYAQSLTI